MTTTWTPRDLDVVETLTRRVRLLAIEQIARIWWPSATSSRAVRRRLRRLAAGGLIHRAIVNAHPLLPIARPLVRWSPDRNDPDFGRASAQARSRWNQPAIPHEVYFASRLGANLLGSSAGKLPDLTHRDHDLLLGQVYVWYRTKCTAEPGCWLGEDALPKAGYRIKDPDAFLVGSGGRFLRVIESAGAYGRAQVESFHEHCLERDLPYELW